MHKYIEGSVTTLTFVFSSKNKKSKTCTRGPPGALQATSHSGEVGARVGLVFKNTKVCAKKTDNISTFVRYYHTVCTYEGRPFTYVTTKYSCTVQYNSNNLQYVPTVPTSSRVSNINNNNKRRRSLGTIVSIYSPNPKET